MALIRLVAAIDCIEDRSIGLLSLIPYGVLADKPPLNIGEIEMRARELATRCRDLSRYARATRAHQARLSALRRFAHRGPRALLCGAAVSPHVMYERRQQQQEEEACRSSVVSAG